MKPKPDPTQSRIRELFRYEHGQLFWKERCHGRPYGKPAGTTHADGYRAVKMDGKIYRVHRLIWVYHNGLIDDGLIIDHKDGDRSNNLLENLQPITMMENTRRGKWCTDRKLKLPRNVYPNGRRSVAYRVQFKRSINGVRSHFNLGSFPTVEEAVIARDNYLKENS